MKKIIKIGFWIIVIVLIAWVGVGIIDSCRGNDTVNPPAPDKAHYRLLIKSNQNIIYTNDYHMDGTIHYLNGYYEQVNDKYKYRKGLLALDENTFGDIIVSIRR